MSAKVRQAYVREIPSPVSNLHLNHLPVVELQSHDGARAAITPYGAHVVSWMPAGGSEALFVSERSSFMEGQAIRGGIPVVFPQFSERGPLPKHGLARTTRWRVVSHEEARVVFALEDSETTRSLWPHAFAIELVVTIGGAALDIELRARNPGNAPFSFTAALHTYFQISDISKVRLEGLPIEVLESLDHVFAGSPTETRIFDVDRSIGIAQRGFRDTVVWNPGPERCAAMQDMEPRGYKTMLCVEAATVESPVVLAAGESWAGGQRITIR